MPVEQEGVPLDPDSIIRLPVEKRNITFPGFCKSTDDPFLRQVEASGKPWVVIADENNSLRLVLDAGGLLRLVLFRPVRTNPCAFCLYPVIICDRTERIGGVILKLRLDPEYTEDSVITDAVILL